MIETRALSVHVGDGAARFELRDVSLVVPAGGYGVVIGPAGAGKTTLLEAIAGVRRLAHGAVLLDGRDVSALPPEGRGLAIVYQHAFLFPHLDVDANCAYGASDPAVLAELRERFGIGVLGRRDVRELSGGERQLVALVRALARRPRTLLLDEPFGALDPARRAAARREVRALQREWGVTVLQVTHDFAEAGALGDVAVLLDRGRVVQQGEPAAVFGRPATAFAATFLGAENVFAGEVLAGEVGAAASPSVGGPPRLHDGIAAGDRRHPSDAASIGRTLDASPDAGGPPQQHVRTANDALHHPADAPHVAGAAGTRHLRFRTGALTLQVLGDFPTGPAHAVLRAEEVLLSRARLDSSARNQFEGRVVELARHGAIVAVTVVVQGVPLVASLTRSAVRELSLAVGDQVWVAFKASAVQLC